MRTHLLHVSGRKPHLQVSCARRTLKEGREPFCEVTGCSQITKVDHHWISFAPYLVFQGLFKRRQSMGSFTPLIQKEKPYEEEKSITSQRVGKAVKTLEGTTQEAKKQAERTNDLETGEKN